MVLECRDGIESVPSRSESQLVDFPAIQERLVEIADFLLDRPLRRVCGSTAPYNALDVHLRLLVQHFEGAPAALVIGYFLGGQPVAVHKAIKIISRLDRLVFGGKINAETTELRCARGTRRARRD